MNPPASTPAPPPPRRPGMHGAAVATAIALTISASGFFMGLRAISKSTAEHREAWEAAPPPAAAGATTDAVPAVVPYARLAEHTLQPNRSWENHLGNLAAPVENEAAFTRLSFDEQQLVRQERASRRQYDGAPPVAPHPLNQMSAATCLECHGKPTVISGVPVARMSHQPHQNCLQCHVSGVGPTSTWRSRPVSLAAGNSFVGKPQPGYGRRAYAGAPPVMPHSTWMRQTCISCHGPGGTSAFRTSHPERNNCLQCHAVNATADQMPSLVGGRNSIPPPLASP